MKTLITGGVRSGKSTYAEGLLADATYLATGVPRDDADWQERVRLHQERRPASWRTLETLDVAAALTATTGPILLDDVGNWLSRTLDALEAWTDETPRRGWQTAYRDASESLVDAIANYEDDLVIVTNEVGFGLVSPYASGRLFTDELGRLNQRIATACDEVVLVVAGCPLVIKDAHR